ncbi:hypothetical protein [Rhodoplanes sp. Z2-YC6860]|uniref:hypothetical protein n=1 Tax=Rhodoplanes sp. Z2-YC6860 TaxID=674703 RepID=UPI00078EA26E|nr:hypothetical protein [Rhodoplanes sp. Z2-YC6860]AMN44055.1 hypothetical protein RHPLAN_56390 [Rhodoplanes sp. Z2-YC6860]
MTKPLTRLWQALDDLPLASTTGHEWFRRLANDSPVSLTLLRSTGTLATEIDCPSPGGIGCPRKVIKLSAGRIRATCGNSPAECDAIDLAAEDVMCLALDRKKLASELCKLLQISPSRDAEGVLIGTYPVMAGKGIPVGLLIPGPEGAETLPSFTELTPPAVLLVPTTTSLSTEANRALKVGGYSLWALNEFVRVNEHHRFVSIHDPEILFESLKTALLATHGPKPIGCIWPLPPNTSWEMLAFTFVDEEKLSVRVGQQTRIFEPDQFGFKDRKTGRYVSAWALLLTMAGSGGKTRPVLEKKRAALEKQKQLLADRLKELFGLDEEPFFKDRTKQTYVARFILRDERPKNARDQDF